MIADARCESCGKSFTKLAPYFDQAKTPDPNKGRRWQTITQTPLELLFFESFRGFLPATDQSLLTPTRSRSLTSFFDMFLESPSIWNSSPLAISSSIGFYIPSCVTSLAFANVIIHHGKIQIPLLPYFVFGGISHSAGAERGIFTGNRTHASTGTHKLTCVARFKFRSYPSLSTVNLPRRPIWKFLPPKTVFHLISALSIFHAFLSPFITFDGA